MKVGFAGRREHGRGDGARLGARPRTAPSAMLFCDAGSGRAGALAERGRRRGGETLAELALRADAVVLAVKPAALESVAEQLGGDGAGDRSRCSAATPVARLRKLFPGVPVCG